MNEEKMMRKAVLVAAALAFGAMSSAALADGCSGRSHAGGSIIGAVGGGLIGNAVSGGSAVGTVGGAVVGGLAGNAIARDIDCDRGRHYDRRRHTYYWYNHHGERVYEERYERRRHRDYDRNYDRDYRRD
jgi:osmotically inducible lipoprotein OsmB